LANPDYAEVNVKCLNFLTTHQLNVDGALKIATSLAKNHSKYPKTPRTLSKLMSDWLDKIDISSSSSKS
jgi:hypothetical protein